MISVNGCRRLPVPPARTTPFTGRMLTVSAATYGWIGATSTIVVKRPVMATIKRMGTTVRLRGVRTFAGLSELR